MFRILSILSFVVLIVLITVDLRKEVLKETTLKLWLRMQWNTARTVWASRRSMKPENVLGVLRGLFYLLTLALCLILALTGFIPVLVLGGHLSGVLLLIHVTAAPLFALSLAILALLWAQRQKFTEENWDTVKDAIARKQVDTGRSQVILQKVCFWLILFFSLPLILSIILGVFPWFGTDGQETLVLLHGVSALLLTVTAVIHTYTITKYSQRRPYYHGERT